MSTKKWKAIAFIFTVALAVCLISAHTGMATAQSIAQTAEAQAIGGGIGACAGAIGLTVGLALSGLSPVCEILCFSLAWYTFGAVAVACG
jgi:LytS/YehU family sensor histidine kinase